MSLTIMEPSRCRFQILHNERKALWQLTNVCNYQCPYCIFASGPSRIEGELTTEQAIGVASQLREEGFSYVKLTGGEPTVRKDLESIITSLGEAGIAFDLSSNASLISEGLLATLARHKPKYVHVSLDGGSEETQVKMRGFGTFSRTIEGITALTTAGIPVRIGTVIGKNNQHNLDQIIELAIHLSASEIVFSRLIPAGRIKGDSSVACTLTDQELAKVTGELRSRFDDVIKISDHFSTDSNYQLRVCPGGDSFIYIDNLGRISPCSWASEKGIARLSQLSLKERALRELLNCEEMTTFRRSIAAQSDVGCPVNGATT